MRRSSLKCHISLITCALHCLTSDTETAASTRPPLTLSSLFKSKRRREKGQQGEGKERSRILGMGREAWAERKKKDGK